MKKKFLQLCSLLLLVFLLQNCTQSKEWESFKYDEYNYFIDYPSEPEYTLKKTKSVTGVLDIHFYILDNSKKKDNYYSSAYVKYPESSINSNKNELLESFFSNSIQGMVKNLHGELLSENIIDLKGYPGREVKISIKDGHIIIKSRIYLVKNIGYILQVMTPTKNDFNKSINKFLDSFELIEY